MFKVVLVNLAGVVVKELCSCDTYSDAVDEAAAAYHSNRKNSAVFPMVSCESFVQDEIEFYVTTVPDTDDPEVIFTHFDADPQIAARRTRGKPEAKAYHFRFTPNKLVDILGGPTGVGSALVDQLELENMAKRLGREVDSEAFYIQTLYKQLPADSRGVLEEYAGKLLEERDKENRETPENTAKFYR